jgi:4-diphosphocytidyl-2-C-methyl-D-erythritol kinase
LALDYFWRLGLKPQDLFALGQKLGADVPMCLHRFALRARGTGERIERIHGWSPLPLLLVWPGRAVATAAVFAALRHPENQPLPDSHVAWGPVEMAEHLAAFRNDLEAPAVALAPVIGEALDALRAADGCLLARMSGSGSACFGLFADRAATRAAAAAVAKARPDWWSVATEAC